MSCPMIGAGRSSQRAGQNRLRFTTPSNRQSTGPGVSHGTKGLSCSSTGGTGPSESVTRMGTTHFRREANRAFGSQAADRRVALLAPGLLPSRPSVRRFARVCDRFGKLLCDPVPEASLYPRTQTTSCPPSSRHTRPPLPLAWRGANSISGSLNFNLCPVASRVNPPTPEEGFSRLASSVSRVRSRPPGSGRSRSRQAVHFRSIRVAMTGW